MLFQQLPITQVSRNPNQPRQHFDGAALAELADSIRSCGLLQPVTVRKMDADAYEVIAGERRFRACQSLGWAELPAMVIENVDDEQAFVLATLENVARKDMRPIEEAKAYAAIASMGKTVDEIAALVGKAAFAVAWRLELLNLAPEFQDVDLPMRNSATS